jgi:putative transcriptional regulator
MTNLGKRLLKAAKEARAIARGEADTADYRAHIPAKSDAHAAPRPAKRTPAVR